MTRCRGCAETWTGLKIAHCATCHRTFTTPANFDRHRVNGECVYPNTRGLVQNDRNHWSQPGRDEA